MDFIPSLYQREIIEKGISSDLFVAAPLKFSLNIHGIPCRFHISCEKLHEQLSNFFPLEWQQFFLEEDPIDIYWVQPQSFLVKDVPLWGEVTSPDCHFIDGWAMQRDFASYKVNERKYFLVADEQIDDGIFNFLRYLLPRELLKIQSIIFHSSCVVDENKDAYLFFGPSNAGKTTMSQLCRGGNVLGDDMNLMRIEDKKVIVESALVGQRYYSRENFGKTFQVKAAFWLKQSEAIQINPIESGRKNKILSSFTGLFWDQLSADEYQKVFKLAQIFRQKMNLYELEFNQTEEVWNYVRFFGKNL